MKKIKLKHKKKIRKYIFVFFLVFFIYTFFLTFTYLEKSNIKIDNETMASILLKESNKSLKVKKKSITESAFKILSDPLTLINNNYKGLVKPKIKKEVNNEKDTSKEATIYIYNSHQSENYKPSNFAEYSVSPTVMVASYILKEKLKEENLSSLVEERSISEYLKQNNKKYVYSYEASRSFLESSKIDNPSLEYFIDVHRDSLPRDKTTKELNGKKYASILFLIGLENPNYQANLDFTTRINNKIESLYPGISKGIYKKEGENVNGVYNQDFSPTTILVEFGGQDNTVDEVFNSVSAFTKAFTEVIKESVS